MPFIFLILMLAAIVGIFRPYKFIKGSKRWHYEIGVVVLFIASVATVPTPPINTAAKDSAPSPKAAGAPAMAPEKVVEAPPESKWLYFTETDQMRNQTSDRAWVESENAIDLDFPYGIQHGTIVVRQSVKSGLDIILQVKSGQILCSSFSNSHLSVKFDAGLVQQFRCVGASDGSANLAFIKDEAAFLAKLKKAKKTIIEAEFYQNGRQQLTFDTHNLDWR